MTYGLQINIRLLIVLLQIGWIAKTALLAMKEMSNCHDGQSIARSVLLIIEDYNFADKLDFFVLDNVLSNDTCVKELGRRVDFNLLEKRLRCVRKARVN